MATKFKIYYVFFSEEQDLFFLRKSNQRSALFLR